MDIFILIGGIITFAGFIVALVKDNIIISLNIIFLGVGIGMLSAKLILLAGAESMYIYQQEFL